MNALNATNTVVSQRGNGLILTFENNYRMTEVRLSKERARRLIEQLQVYTSEDN